MKKEFIGEDEDLIFKNKQFISELQKVETLYFETLCEELKVNEIGKDWVFDYVFNNQDEDMDFLTYLDNYSVDQSTLFKK
jgi:hypothetical protein